MGATTAGGVVGAGGATGATSGAGAGAGGFFLKKLNMGSLWNAVDSKEALHPLRQPTITRPYRNAMAAPSARPSPPHEVRIIGGQWKRTKLPVADKPGLRPTLDRVRETLFNWLGQDLTGWHCLDAFAGTGALGFEAASRGATDVVLLEQDAALVRQLLALKTRLNATMVRVERADALAWMQRAPAAQFDLILLDPPFAAGLFEAALQASIRLLQPQGFIYLEADAPLDDAARARLNLHTYREGRAGAVYFQLLCLAPGR